MDIKEKQRTIDDDSLHQIMMQHNKTLTDEVNCINARLKSAECDLNELREVSRAYKRFKNFISMVLTGVVIYLLTSGSPFEISIDRKRTNNNVKGAQIENTH